MIRARLERLLERLWYGGSPLAWLLAPLSLPYCLVASGRRLAYRRGWLAAQAVGVPVVVVGNLTVGGTGKTPLVLWLARLFGDAGWRVGIVGRGYGGRDTRRPRDVSADSDPRQVGDEAVLLAARSGRPVVVCRDRVAAARRLVTTHGCDLVLADDGLQHYRLARTLEIAVVDAQRGLGNRLCLPAGPLREPAARLRGVDFELVNGGQGVGAMQLRVTGVEPVGRAGESARLADFGAGPVHAVAGIGHPGRFFAMLRAEGLSVIEHAFPDHHAYRAAELDFGDGLPVLMTDKDAVKCRAFDHPGLWSVGVEARPDAGFGPALLARLQRTRCEE